MINSLSKDSHITRTFGQHKLYSSREFVLNNERINTTADKCEIKNKRPSEITFRGSSSSLVKEKGPIRKFLGKIHENTIKKLSDKICESTAFKNTLKWIYESDAVKSTLKFVNDQQLVFGAAFALLLTCILRPASIMVLPSKKNQDDQKYASGHSIASGVIGFAISTIIFTPISRGVKRFQDICNGKDKKDTVETYLKDKKHYLLTNEQKLKAATKYLERIPDIVGAIPKGILTVMLIPPILKYVFGMEKKKKTDNNNKINYTAVDYSLLNYQKDNSANKSRITNFAGGLK